MFRTASSLLLRAWLRAAAVIGEAAGAEPKSQPRSTVSCTGVGPRSCSVSPVCSTCVQLPLLQPVHVVLAERPACSGALASLCHLCIQELRLGELPGGSRTAGSFPALFVTHELRVRFPTCFYAGLNCCFRASAPKWRR